MNAKIAINWLETSLNTTGVESTNHIIGITANTENAIRFGIKASNILNFSNWVGGRYSIWSSIGLSIAIYIGFDNFDQMLKGARLIDHHFRETSFSKNIPIVMALIGFWYNNFLNAQSHAVIPYCERLSLLPSYIQQLDMESNGKSVSQSGEKISYQTGPVIWGQTGTNGQHAFFQLLHQGTKLIPIDFIAPVKQSNSYKTIKRYCLTTCLLNPWL
jgi:glucose-6-phosphate isomerase